MSSVCMYWQKQYTYVLIDLNIWRILLLLEDKVNTKLLSRDAP